MIVPKHIEELLKSTKVLIVDDEAYMRKVIRSLLMFVGIRKVEEAGDGLAGIEAISVMAPDIVILDWQMPLLNGPEFVRMVRSPETFSHPQVPIIMLSGHVERSKVIEAINLGVNEFICKPVSAKTLVERIISIRTNPRQFVKLGNYYGPAPRKTASEIVKKVHSADSSELAWLE